MLMLRLQQTTAPLDTALRRLTLLRQPDCLLQKLLLALLGIRQNAYTDTQIAAVIGAAHVQPLEEIANSINDDDVSQIVDTSEATTRAAADNALDARRHRQTQQPQLL